MPGAPEGLDLWSFKFIDMQRHPLEKWVGEDSPLVGLFRLERLGDLDELPGLTREIKARLGPEDQALADAFVELVNEVVLGRLTPKGAPRPRITDLEEVPSMLAQRIDEITHGWESRGRKKGRLEEAAHLFLELFATKHGTVPEDVRKRVASASKTRLETWAKRLFTAESPEDVFKD